jgi:hypothetical protein
VKFRLIEMDISGDKTKIYSPELIGETKTLYERFVEENVDNHEKEVLNLDTRLEIIGHETGLFEESFDSKAGKFGENLCTLKDKPKRKLRLFFIEYLLKNAMIVGGGGEKPASARATQDIPKLDSENRLLGEISLTIQAAEKAGVFEINDDGTIYPSDFIFDTGK